MRRERPLGRRCPSVPFRKFDEEVLCTLRVPSASPPSPRPGSRPSRMLREAHARGSPPGSCRRHSRQWRRGPPLPALRCAQRGASVATGGSARGGSQGGGGPSAPRLLQDLTPPPARLPPGDGHTRRGRGQGWGWRTTTAVRHARVARPRSCTSRSPAAVSRRTYDARHQECDEEALVPKRNPCMWWLGLFPNHHIHGSLLGASGLFITLLSRPARGLGPTTCRRDGRRCRSAVGSRREDRGTPALRQDVRRNAAGVGHALAGVRLPGGRGRSGRARVGAW